MATAAAAALSQMKSELSIFVMRCSLCLCVFLELWKMLINAWIAVGGDRGWVIFG